MNFFRLNRNLFFFSAIIFFTLNASAKISFSSLNLNERDEVLFALKHNVPGSIEYSTIFKSKIKNGEAEYFPRALTCFPEKMEAFDEGKKVLIRNRYGSAVYDFEKDSLKWIERAASFPDKMSAPLPATLSSTGKWYCMLEHGDLFKGRLVIIELATGKKIVLDDNSPFSYSAIPVKWSPDGENFLYEKKGSVYLCNAEKLFKDVLLKEDFRKVCTGSIHSTSWNKQNNVVYIASDLIFQVEPKEIFSLGLYAQFVPLGKILGRLPQKFDSVRDKFWMNEETKEFCVIRHDEAITWYKMDFNFTGDIYVETVCTLAFVVRDMHPLSFEAFWTEKGELALCAKLVHSGTGIENHAVYTIDKTGKLTRQILVEDTYSNFAVSPDKSHIAFLAGTEVFVYKISSWKPVCQLKNEKSVSLAWRDGTNLCVGGTRSVKKLSVSNFAVSAIFPSSANSAWWTNDKKIAFIDSKYNIYTLSEEDGFWQREDVDEEKGVVQNDRYRVLCATTKNALYENALYVRTLKGKITTKALVEKTAAPMPPRRKVALVFDIDEDVEGLNSILAICNDYNLKCTFFFNGEFIRRYPNEAKKIAGTGHECAAIFFNNINLLDKAVYGDGRFIAKGLARLEDEFFSTTGKELSLYWHAPYNKADKKVREEGAAAGYTYVDFSASHIIQVGLNLGKSLSSAALYEKFDLFVNELLITGAELVTISELYN